MLCEAAGMGDRTGGILDLCEDFLTPGIQASPISGPPLT